MVVVLGLQIACYDKVLGHGKCMASCSNALQDEGFVEDVNNLLLSRVNVGT